MSADFTVVARLVSDASAFESGISSAVKSLNSLPKSGYEQMKALSGVMTSFGSTMAKSITAPIATGVAGAIKSYADLEQAIGGIETLFGKDTSPKVIENANRAFKTAGVSATSYMEQVTSFSARLLQGLGGDTEAAAKYADMAITDMADNANKFGTNLGMIQNAYQGFAKGNFTMLDNLKLGYGGTQEEMARLVNESGVLNGEFEATAENVKDIPFDTLIKAINKTQERLGVTGTTAKEASETISGSFGSMMAAAKNLASGLANPAADVKKLIIDLGDTIKTFSKNVKRALKTIWDNLPIAPWKKWAGLIVTLAGPALLAIGKLIDMFLAIPKALGALKGAITLLTSPMGLVVVAIGLLVAAIVWLWNTNEDFRNAVIKIWEDVKEKVSSAIEGVSKIIQDVWGNVMSWWNENQDGILSKASEVWNSLMNVVSQVSSFISRLVQRVWGSIKSWWDSNQEGFFTKASEIWGNISDVIMGLYDWFVGTFQGLWDSLVSWWNNNQESFKSTASSVWDTIKNTFSIVFNTISGIVKSVWEPVSSWFQENQELIRQTVTTIWNGILSVISFIINNIVPIVVNGWNLILNVTKPIWNIISNVIESVMDFILGIIKSVMQAINGDWSGAWNTIKDTFTTIWNSISEFLGSILDTLWQLISNGIQLIVESWKTEWEETKATAENIWNSIVSLGKTFMTNINNAITEGVGLIKDVWDGFWGGLQETISGFLDPIVEKISGFVTSIQTTLEPVANFLANPFEVGGGLINGAIEGVKGATKSGWESIKNSFTWGRDSVTQASQEASNNVVATSSGVTSASSYYETFAKGSVGSVSRMNTKVSSELSGVSSSANTEGQNLEDTKSYYESLHQLAWSSAMDMNVDITESYGAMRRRVSEIFEELKTNAVKSFNSMRLLTTTSSTSMKTSVTNIFNSMRTSINSIMRAVVSTIRSNMSGAVSAMRSASGQARTIGYNMGVGFYNGLASMAGSIISLARSIANSAAATMRSALRIHSPSRVTSAIGGYTGEGFYDGMKSWVNPIGSLSEMMALSAVPPINDSSIAQLNGQGVSSVGTLDVENQPMDITLNLGKHEFRVFTEDISKQQELNLVLEGY